MRYFTAELFALGDVRTSRLLMPWAVGLTLGFGVLAAACVGGNTASGETASLGAEPTVTATSVQTAAPEATADPGPTASPEPTAAPAPTGMPEPTTVPTVAPTPSSLFVKRALDVIDGSYPAADAAPITDVVDITSMSVSKFDGAWFAIAESIDGGPLALTSTNGLKWQPSSKLVAGLPEDMLPPYKLWALGDGLVLRGNLGEADFFGDSRHLFARSSDGFAWNSFPSEPGAGFGFSIGFDQQAVTTDGSTFAYLGAYEYRAASPTLGAPSIYVLFADADPSDAPLEISAPPDFEFLAVHGLNDEIVVDIVLRNLQLHGLGTVGRHSSEVEPLIGNPIRSTPIRAVVGHTLFDFANRASFDLGLTFNSFDLRDGSETVFLPSGAITREDRFSTEGFVSRDGFLWEPIALPALQFKVLTHTEDGVLLVFWRGGEDPVIGFVPWPDTVDATVEDLEQLRLERNETRIKQLTGELVRSLFVDQGFLVEEQRCVSETSVQESVLAVLEAATECGLDVFGEFVNQLDDAFVTNPALSSQQRDCNRENLADLTVDEFRASASLALDFIGLLVNVASKLAGPCLPTPGE